MTRRLVFAGLATAALGFAAGALTGDRTDPRHAAVAAAAQRLAAAAAAGDTGALWTALCAETRELYAHHHACLLGHVRGYLDDAPEGADAIAARRMAQDYGMPLADILETTPRSLWEWRMGRALGDRAARDAFRRLAIRRVGIDADRAVVDGLLPTGRPQGFHFVREDGAWRLLDFHPYWPARRWTVPRNTIRFG